MEHFKKRIIRFGSFLKKNLKLILNITLGVGMILAAIYFFKNEVPELNQINDILIQANFFLVLLGVIICMIYVLLHALMYTSAFRSIGERISLKNAIILFLKRNFVSVFLPAGGVSSLAFFTTPIEKSGVEKKKIHFASTIYGIIGVFSVLLVAIPVLIYMVFNHTASSNDIDVFIAFLILVAFIISFLYSLFKRGIAYRLVIKIVPSFTQLLEEIKAWNPNLAIIARTTFYSVLIEFVCVFYLYISMVSLDLAPSFEAALASYIISVLILNVSPFLRGLGAIEITITYVLTRYGFSPMQAVSITFVYRFFEFWLPLVAGILTFIFTPKNIFLRIIPAALIFILGIVNIISALTPAMSGRLNVLKGFLPLDAINASNYLVLTSGLILIATAVFLLKGLKNAWTIALFITIISFVGNLTKAIDYEEATLALFVAMSLLITRKAYYMRSNIKLQRTGIFVSLISMCAVLIYGTTGFYFLDVHHFGIDFTLRQAILQTLNYFFLIGSGELHPTNKLATNFLYSINISGFSAMAFLLYSLVRPFVFKTNITGEEENQAKQLVIKNGNSSLDYFKTTADKLYFFSSDQRSFLSYRISKNYAVVLEKPVSENEEELKKIIKEFDVYCKRNNLKNCYYRVDKSDLDLFTELKKKTLLIGQEGIIDLKTFSLLGGEKKAIRNAVIATQQKGFKVKIYRPPVKDGLLQRLKTVSDEWLDTTGYDEMIFSQGSFDANELKQQTIITLENSDEKVIAFANIIPDYAKDEGTYDLIRKTKDAPSGALDSLMIELIRYFKTTGRKSMNIGMAPFSGIEEGKNIPERTIKFAYQKLKQFSYYKGLRAYKSKFDPIWVNKYLIYNDDYDLIRIPSILNKVMKP